MAREKKAAEGAPKKRATRKKTVAAPAEPVEQNMTQAAETGKTTQTAGMSPASPATRAEALTPEEVRRRAYELWEKRGREHGKHEDDWYKAERELRGKSA